MASYSDVQTQRSPLVYIGILGGAVVLAVALVLFFSGDDGVSATTPGAEDEVTQAPTGAGTNPDGVADEAQEGLMNETATDDFVESSSAADATTVEPDPEMGGEPATSAESVEPAAPDGADMEEIVPESETQSGN